MGVGLWHAYRRVQRVTLVTVVVHLISRPPGYNYIPAGNRMKRLIGLAIIVLVAVGCGSAPAHKTHHHTAATAAASTVPLPTLACSDIAGNIDPVVADMNRQDKLNRTIIRGDHGGLALSTEADIAAGAWNPPGTYSNDLNSLMDAFTVSTQYQPGQLLSDMTKLVSDGQQMQSDVQGGGQYAGLPTDTDFATFQGDVIKVAGDCGMHVVYPWAVRAQQNGTI